MKLTLLKLGGSLLTDKSRPRSERTRLIERLASELYTNYSADPDLRIIIGTGAGSYGHYEASRHSLDNAYGIAKIGMAAQELNGLVAQAMLEAGLPATAMHPSSFLTVADGNLDIPSLEPLIRHLQAKLIPVLHGDAIINQDHNGHIVSTEALFDVLTHKLLATGHHVDRVIYGTIVDGVLNNNGETIPLITPANVADVEQHLYTPPGFDVTGGMKLKLASSLELAQLGLSVQIVDLQPAGALQKVLSGADVGTKITS